MGMYMREYWVAVGKSPIVYRYIDWSITVPLQMIEFNLILKAAKAPIGAAGFWKLLGGTVAMLAFGFAGETGKAAQGNVSTHVRQSFNNMRIIVSLGWSIYPAGYFLGQLFTSDAAAEALNVTYNVADFVNKIAFVLACWSCAKAEAEEASEKLLP